MLRFSRLVLADVGLGELRQAKRKIDIRARVIDAPASAVALEGIAKHDAAEVKASVEVLCRRRAGAEAESAAPTKLRVGGDCGAEHGSKDHDRVTRTTPALHAAQCTI